MPPVLRAPPFSTGGMVAAGVSGPKQSTRWTALPLRSDTDAVSALVRQLIAQSKSVRRSEEANWYVDIKYVSGDQWISWDPAKASLYTKPKKPWRIRQTVNHQRPNLEVLINVLTSRRPRAEATAGSTDQDDRKAAKAAMKFWSSLWLDLDMDELLDELASWTLTCGLATAKVGWDAMAGEDVELPDWSGLEEGVLPGPGYEPPMQTVRTGQITTDVLPSFNAHRDPAATSLRRARWAGDEGYMHVEECRERWPKIADKIHADGGQDVWYNYARRLNFEHDSRGNSSDVADTCTVRELHFRPDGKHPRGRKITLVGAVVAEDTEDTPIDGEFPYADFLCYRNPGSYLGQSAANLGRNTQTSLNRNRSLVMESLLKGNANQWLVIKGAGVKKADLTDEPGNVVYANPIANDPVRALVPTPLPPAWHNLLSVDLQDHRDIMGVVDVLRGNNPAGVRSGRGQSYLIEQANNRHAPLLGRFERGIARLGKLWLLLAQKYYAEDRVVRTIGDTGRVEAYELKIADLRAATDLHITAGSSMPESKVARQDFVMQLYKAGLILDDAGRPDAKRALRLMEMTELGTETEEDEADRSWAEDENELMAHGQPVMPQPHDNSDLHARTHVAYMRTPQYRALPPEIKALFRQHLDGTILMLQAGTTGPQPGTLPGPQPEAGGGEPGAGQAAGSPTNPPGEPRSDQAGGP